tara:strand:+ start:545 stop:727 length:183 start_codon:yes stop_codon:yes gene_type:complete
MMYPPRKTSTFNNAWTKYSTRQFNINLDKKTIKQDRVTCSSEEMLEVIKQALEVANAEKP